MKAKDHLKAVKRKGESLLTKRTRFTRKKKFRKVKKKDVNEAGSKPFLWVWNKERQQKALCS